LQAVRKRPPRSLLTSCSFLNFRLVLRSTSSARPLLPPSRLRAIARSGELCHRPAAQALRRCCPPLRIGQIQSWTLGLHRAVHRGAHPHGRRSTPRSRHALRVTDPQKTPPSAYSADVAQQQFRIAFRATPATRSTAFLDEVEAELTPAAARQRRAPGPGERRRTGRLPGGRRPPRRRRPRGTAASHPTPAAAGPCRAGRPGGGAAHAAAGPAHRRRGDREARAEAQQIVGRRARAERAARP
jgi:hypothetical protein